MARKELMMRRTTPLEPPPKRRGQFGKNRFGDLDEMLPANHGFDEFCGNLYHLNAEEEPENPDYPKDPDQTNKMFGTNYEPPK
jgi:arylsulfatase